MKQVEPNVNLDYQLSRAQAVLDWFSTTRLDAGPAKPIGEKAMTRLHHNLTKIHENFKGRKAA